ncbi:hypothetical protein [Pelotalea chapellei]|uniref:Uncharacterized protein n=1 Tax=Pelotalea chapellei TaxID=44671 RepID=A0ABS5U5Z9_9BACT|nr:hypothetical protein [Pelotalea chapellei]MBT1071074.1 hypothetical protein [Pelotalea chapellei]
MLAVEKWAQNKHPLIALFAPQVAAFAREAPDILKHQKSHRLLSHTFPVPDLPSWHAMYRSHRRYINPFLEMIFQASPYARHLIEFGAALQDIPRHLEQFKEKGISPEQLKEGQEYLKEILQMSFAEIQGDLDDTPLTPEVRAAVQQYKDNDETALAFMFLVAYPCWFLYKEWPSRLYHKAIKGDTTAIHKLLRLDPFTLHDPAIGKQIQHIRIHGRQSLYAELLAAPLKPVRVKLTSRTIKDMLAGAISLLAEAIKQPLTSTDIRDLFDAVAQDADKQEIDTSLPESQEAYSKVIQRNRPDWKPLLQPGQKKVK